VSIATASCGDAAATRNHRGHCTDREPGSSRQIVVSVAGLPCIRTKPCDWKTFLTAREGEKLVACAGAEAYQFAALIRSVAVDPEHRSLGIGRKLVRQLIDRLASRGLREFYLLTTTAEAYFKKRGFKVIDRDEVHPQLLSSREFQDACPDSAICMRLVMLA
jgi:amino-acid N-acetyltransferase